MNCRICNVVPAQRDGYCRRCRCLHGFVRRKFFWTEEQIETLRWAYRAESVKELKKRVDQLVAMTGFPRQIVQKEARRRCLSATHRPWTEREKQFVRDNVGRMTTSQMARALHRGQDTTAQLIYQLGFSARVREGYTVKDVQQALGVSSKRTDRWFEQGWLKKWNGRVSEVTLRKFLREHPEEYSLRRVDEYWFKSMLFPSFGQGLIPKGEKEVA